MFRIDEKIITGPLGFAAQRTHRLGGGVCIHPVYDVDDIECIISDVNDIERVITINDLKTTIRGPNSYLSLPCDPKRAETTAAAAAGRGVQVDLETGQAMLHTGGPAIVTYQHGHKLVHAQRLVSGRKRGVQIEINTIVKDKGGIDSHASKLWDMFMEETKCLH